MNECIFITHFYHLNSNSHHFVPVLLSILIHPILFKRLLYVINHTARIMKIKDLPLTPLGPEEGIDPLASKRVWGYL